MDVNSIIRDIVGIKKPLPRKSLYSRDWLSWYRGNVRGFHNYRIYNGQNYLDLERKSLKMPKYIVESWANLLMNERCDIVLPDGEKEKLDDILYKTNFWSKANEGVEKAFALGIGALVVDVKGLMVGEKSRVVNKDKARISISFVNETKIFPITVEEMRVTECAFVSRNTNETRVVVHLRGDNGEYIIHNYLMDEHDKLQEHYTFNTKSEIPWFFIIRPNTSSNFITELTDEELGVSIFANSIDTFKSIDNKYDGFDLEFVLGRKRMFISTEAWTVNKMDGEATRTFDPYDTLFYHLPDNSEGKPLITTKSDVLRYQAYIEGINIELNYLSMKCGLGENFFRFDGTSIQTATQVISENSTLYRNIKKHELILEEVLLNLAKVVIKASNDFTKTKFSDIKPDEIRVVFDDSIIEDKNAEMERDRLDVQAGIMSVPEYREKWYGEDEETAHEKYNDYFLYKIVDNYINALNSGGITPKQYVEKVFHYAPNKKEIIQYIEDYVGKDEPDVEDFIFDEGKDNDDEGDEE